MTEKRQFLPNAIADLGNERNLCVSNPTVEFVTNLESGECLDADKAIGSDPRILSALRSDLSARALKNTELSPSYVCSLCHVPVRISCTTDGQHFYFKHPPKRENACPQNPQWFDNRSWIEAAKYNGAKESQAHKDMKRLITQSLEVDKSFSDVREETTWKGSTPWEWRKPDVSATFRRNKDFKIAFEVQLSTTFLDIISGRREFYKKEKGLLFWIFKNFDIDAARMTGLDIFHSNNCNAFVIDDETLITSLRFKKFYVRCIWPEPKRHGFSLNFEMKESVIPFSEIKFDIDSQSTFFYDYDKHAKIIKEQIAKDISSIEKEKEEIAEAERRNNAITKFKQNYSLSLERTKAMFLFRGICPNLHLSDDIDLHGKLVSFVNTLYSARDGRPYGLNYDNNDQVFHYVYDNHREFLLMYCCAFSFFGHVFADKQGKVRGRKNSAWKELKEKGCASTFFPDRRFETLMDALLPEAYLYYLNFCQSYNLFKK